MPTIQWNDTYSTKVQFIDDDHKKLIDYINKLFDAMKSGQAKEVLGRILSDLVTYTDTHFKNEERQMQIHTYPDFVSHKALHDDLRKKALDIKKRYDSGQMAISVELSDFLVGWLKHHIEGTDKKLGAFLNTKGVK